MQLLLQRVNEAASMSASSRRPCRCCGCGMRTVREFEQARQPTKGKSGAAARPTSPKCAAPANALRDWSPLCTTVGDVDLYIYMRQRALDAPACTRLQSITTW